jgi:general secretion pathway protein A
LYNNYYNLKEDAFRLTPDTSFLYMTSLHREALAGLVHSACTRSGLTVLTGEAGTGKTMLLHVLRSWLEKRQFIMVFCSNPILTRDEFYDLLLEGLQISCSSSLKSRQLLALQETLLRYRAEGRRSLLIVDEAHALPRELLEEIRLLLNIETQREKLLDIIMAGQPELTEMLRRAELRQIKQRVNCFCKLEPLSVIEVREYIEHRLVRAGLRQQTIFPEDTIQLIHQYSQGIPRLVNTMCDNALATGFALQRPKIDVSIIREVAVDLDLAMETKIPVAEPSHAAIAVMPSPPSPAVSAPVVAAQAANGRDRVVPLPATDRTPLETYAARQKSVGFLANLMDRWK